MYDDYFYIEWHCFLFSNPKKYFEVVLSKKDIKDSVKKYFDQVKADINEIRKG